jgi:hypothetical protein
MRAVGPGSTSIAPGARARPDVPALLQSRYPSTGRAAEVGATFPAQGLPDLLADLRGS